MCSTQDIEAVGRKDVDNMSPLFFFFFFFFFQIRLDLMVWVVSSD